MKALEVSRKIVLSGKTDGEALKAKLLDFIGRGVDIEDVTGDDSQFTIKGTTGSPASMTRHARLDLNVDIVLEAKVARVMVSGFSKAAPSLTILYTILFVFLLLVGLLPGFIETNADRSGALDALVFLIFGIYIVTDVNKKLAEPKELLESALESLDTMFG